MQITSFKRPKDFGVKEVLLRFFFFPLWNQVTTFHHQLEFFRHFQLELAWGVRGICSWGNPVGHCSITSQEAGLYHYRATRRLTAGRLLLLLPARWCAGKSRSSWWCCSSSLWMPSARLSLLSLKDSMLLELALTMRFLDRIWSSNFTCWGAGTVAGTLSSGADRANCSGGEFVVLAFQELAVLKTGFLVAGFSRCLGATGQEHLNSMPKGDDGWSPSIDLSQIEIWTSSLASFATLCWGWASTLTAPWRVSKLGTVTDRSLTTIAPPEHRTFVS